MLHVHSRGTREIPIAGQINGGDKMTGGSRLPGVTIIKSKQKSIYRGRQSSQSTFYVANRPPFRYNTFPLLSPSLCSLSSSSPRSSCFFFVFRCRHVPCTNNPCAREYIRFSTLFSPAIMTSTGKLSVRLCFTTIMYRYKPHDKIARQCV